MTKKRAVNVRTARRVAQTNEVNGVCMVALQAGIQWKGRALLRLTGEESECLLAEWEWPKNSGNVYYACASTGLLFDKQSGECRQSTRLALLIDTVEPQPCSAAYFRKWLAGRMVGQWGGPPPKRGPKPKGSRPVDEDAEVVDEMD